MLDDVLCVSLLHALDGLREVDFFSACILPRGEKESITA